MKHLFFIVLSINFMAKSMETGDCKELTQEFYCNTCFMNNGSNMVQQSAIEKILPECELEMVTKSLNRRFILYKNLCNHKDHSHHRNMYYLTTSEGTIIDKWRDYYNWRKHTAINNDGTYIITKREQDYWLRKITYGENSTSCIHAVTPIQITLFPLFFLNQNVLITLSEEANNGRALRALCAWDISQSFGEQKCVKKNIYTPGKIIPQIAYRVWDEDRLLVADCKEHTRKVQLSLWNLRDYSDQIWASYDIDNTDLTLPVIAAISLKKRYIACAIGHKLFVKDLWQEDKSFYRQSSGTINSFCFCKNNQNNKNVDSEDDCIKYSITEDRNERIWAFKTLNAQATQ